MYIVVFSKEDRDLLMSMGGVYIGEQNLKEKVYIIKKTKDVNFENLDIKYIETNDLVF